MAGVLDGARLGYESKVLLNDFQTPIKPYVIGSHSDDMLPLLRHSLYGAENLADRLDLDSQQNLIRETKNGGAKIVSYYQQGSAYFAPASAVVKMLELIANPQDEEVVCSVYIQGEYGLQGIYIGLPIKLGKKGVEKIVNLTLNKQEQEILKISAQGIKKQVEILKNNGLLN